MQSILGNRSARRMERRPGAQTATFGLDFRTPVAEVTGFNLAVDHTGLLLELLTATGEVAAVALLPRPEMQDLT